MLSIHAELRKLIEKLDAGDVPYALCGALALAAFGHPRATLDIDVVALNGSAGRILDAGRSLGFTLHALPMTFAGGAVRIDRISKADTESEDILSLDVLTLAEDIGRQVQTEAREWDGLALEIVSRESLILLKRLRGSAQDAADIERLL